MSSSEVGGPEVLKVLDQNLILRVPEVPVCPPSGVRLKGRTPEEQRIANLWNCYGAAIYREAAGRGLPVETTLAVFSVESGQAYDPLTGLVIIRFEPGVFKKRSGQAVSCRRKGQKEEWQNLERAFKINAEAALFSCSYGLPQLMGFNWKVTAHRSVREMVLAFQRSAAEQVAAFFGFVEKSRLVHLIVKQDWRQFARYYNGPGNIEGYAGKLKQALMAAKTLKESGARFETG